MHLNLVAEVEQGQLVERALKQSRRNPVERI